MKGASGRYAGQMVNRSGTVNCAKVRFAGIVRVVSTTPGRMLPQIEPMPGKFDAAPKLLSSPLGVPMRLGKRGAQPVRRRAEFGAGARGAGERLEAGQGGGTAHPLGGQDDGRAASQKAGAEEELRVRQVEG